MNQHASHAGQEHTSQEHAGHDHAQHGPLKTSAHATFHCLIGCYFGDAVGITAGVHFGLGPWISMATAVVCAYIAGFALAIQPIMREMDFSFTQAMRVVWLGEAISIASMELAMNTIDYVIGGVQANAIDQPVFWIGLIAAAPAGFFAAWPVNHWLLKKEIKSHH